MTIADPYPKELSSLDDIPFTPIDHTLEPISEVPLIAAVNRVAAALEQIALAILDKPSQPAQNAPQRPPAALAALPPVQAQQPAPNGSVCPIHNAPWKTVPAGVSKKTGKPYDAFQACSIAGCDQRPPR